MKTRKIFLIAAACAVVAALLLFVQAGFEHTRAQASIRCLVSLRDLHEDVVKYQEEHGGLPPPSLADKAFFSTLPDYLATTLVETGGVEYFPENLSTTNDLFRYPLDGWILTVTGNGQLRRTR